MKKAIKCADLLPSPGGEEVIKIANSHLLVSNELATTKQLLAEHRIFFDQLRGWMSTLAEDVKSPEKIG